MIIINKTSLTFLNFMDSEEVDRAVRVAGTRLNEDWILSYDTKKEIVYHSTTEIDKAIVQLNSYNDKFNEIYAENEDIHDCLDNGIVEEITLKIIKLLWPHAEFNKYFMSLYDYLEMRLILRYNTLKIRNGS